jgi:ACS family sodium-dependent inorganic phosphate cotransporter
MVFAFLGCIGMAITYGLKINLSITIVAMVNQSALKEAHHEVHGPNLSHVGQVCHSEHIDQTHKNSAEDGTLMWTQPQQGLVLGSYFWGYFCTQVPAGRVAEMYGGKWIFFAAIVINIICTLLGPVCATAGYGYLVFMRVLMGLGGGLTFPAMNVLIAEWAPKQERSSMSALIYSGTSLGTVVAIPTSGVIAANLGWEAVFYIHGGLSIIWCLLWVFCVTDDTSKHPFMSDEEKTLIHENHARVERKVDPTKNDGKKPKGPPVPWKAIATSVPFIALTITHTLNNFGWYMLLVELPSFMASGLGFNIKENAVLSMIPFLCNWIYSIVYSRLMDMLAQRKLITTTWIRKLSMGIASVIPACCLIGVSLSGCDKSAVVACMIVATLFYGSMFTGVFANHVDIASNFAGVLMGITNMAATIPGFVVPALVGALTHDNPGLAAWHTVFWITIGLLFLEFIVFTIFGTSNVQPWNTPKDGGDYEMPAAVYH